VFQNGEVGSDFFLSRVVRSYVDTILVFEQAGIAENDLMRKVNDAAKYLSKGHNCRITATCGSYLARQDPDTLMDLVERLKEEIGDAGFDTRGVQANKQATYATLLLQPNKKR